MSTSNTVSDTAVEWFGASHRLIGGQPDACYGWLTTPEGPCIVKALDAGLTAYAGTLLRHERAMLRRLQQLQAPVPAMLETGRADWLVTRFGGLSLQRLERGGGFAATPDASNLSATERLAAWVHLLRRLQPLADAGVLAIDLYSANVVLPLTGGVEGQLRLHEAALIDHAHTLEAGMNMRRPVWLDRHMRRIAPELREALQADQEALIAAFRSAGAELPGYSRMPGAKDEFNRRVWAEYDAPQRLQALLDQGSLSRDHAMQFAAGVELQRLLPLLPAKASLLKPVLARMTAEQAGDRYDSLSQAAEALATVLENLPLVSRQVYGPLQAQDLAAGALVGPTPSPLPSPYPAPAPAPAPAPTPTPTPTPTPNPPDPDHTTLAGDVGRSLPMHWIYWACGIGAALGVILPLP